LSHNNTIQNQRIRKLANASTSTKPCRIIKSLTFAHDDAVVVRATALGGGGALFLAGLDLDAIDVLTLVDQLPQLADDLVDLADLQRVEVLQSLVPAGVGEGNGDDSEQSLDQMQ
jgi:uncharacterized protein YgfB (UPF0149 family)